MNTSLGPGPGSYEFKETKMKIAYTMGSKKELQRAGEAMNMTLPGPGSYTPRDSFYHPTGGRIGTERRIESGSRSNLLVPGPGRYDSLTSLTGNRSPRYGFGTQEKFFDNKQKAKMLSSSPGPGSYNFKKIIGNEGSKFSMGENKPSKPLHIDKVPGPGSYSFDMKPQSPQYRLVSITLELGPQSALILKLSNSLRIQPPEPTPPPTLPDSHIPTGSKLPLT